jgi:hypothetical protein
MANTIQFRRSSTPAAVPVSLVAGEIAVNRADKELYYLNADDEIVSLFSIDCGEIVAGGISLWAAEFDGNWHWSD